MAKKKRKKSNNKKLTFYSSKVIKYYNLIDESVEFVSILNSTNLTKYGKFNVLKIEILHFYDLCFLVWLT